LQPIPFEILSDTATDGVQLLSVRGELDLNTAPRFDEELSAALKGSRSLVVDLSDCEFIDSTGVALLVKAWQELGDGRGPRQFVLCCPNRQVRRLLEVTGLDEQIQIRPDLESAVKAAGAGATAEPA
jgi:anti-anti-sigma factor